MGKRKAHREKSNRHSDINRQPRKVHEVRLVGLFIYADTISEECIRYNCSHLEPFIYNCRTRDFNAWRVDVRDDFKWKLTEVIELLSREKTEHAMVVYQTFDSSFTDEELKSAFKDIPEVSIRPLENYWMVITPAINAQALFDASDNLQRLKKQSEASHPEPITVHELPQFKKWVKLALEEGHVTIQRMSF